MAGPLPSIDLTHKALYRVPDGRATKKTMRRQIESLQRALDMESMNGQCIMECRDYIQKTLGANATIFPGIASAFFDDLVRTIVNQLALYQKTFARMVAQQQQATITQTSAATAWVNVGTAALTNTTPSYQSMVGTNMPMSVWAQTAAHNVPRGGYPPDPIVHDDGSITYKPQDKRPCIIELPDGAVIDIKADGSYTIEDSKATVIYRACRVREFNKYLNASDLLEDFIKYVGKVGVKSKDFMGLPIKLFIGWLVLKAAEADGEPEASDDAQLIEDLRKVAA